jgi:hypothetical protein
MLINKQGAEEGTKPHSHPRGSEDCQTAGAEENKAPRATGGRLC